MTPDFLLTSLIVVIAPGTGVLYTLGIGLARGGGAAVAAALGCTFGIVPHLAAAILGVAALLEARPGAFALLRLLGVAYLAWMAWSVLRGGGPLDVAPATDRRAWPRIAVTGTLVNVLNPKLSLFFLAFLPQFVPPDAPGAVARMAGLGAAFMAMTFAVFCVYGLFAARIGPTLMGRPRVAGALRLAFAGALGVLALRLLLPG